MSEAKQMDEEEKKNATTAPQILIEGIGEEGVGEESGGKAETAATTLEHDSAFLEIENEKLRRDVEKARADAVQANDARLRALAELDNMRKRAEREKDEIRKYGIESLLRETLAVWDNLTRAVSHASNKSDPVVQGVELVLRQFADVLQRFGVVPFYALGEKFDPARHEAISRTPMDAPEGTVGVEVACGFMLRDRLFRPAMVVVSEGRREEEKEKENMHHRDTEHTEEDTEKKNGSERRAEAGAEAGAVAEAEAGADAGKSEVGT